MSSSPPRGSAQARARNRRSEWRERQRSESAGWASRASLERVAPQAALHDKEVKADACEDDEEHDGRHRRPHRRIAELQLVAKESAIEKSAQNVRGEIGPGKRSLDRIDEVEGVEVADEGQNRDEADGREHQRQLDMQEDTKMAETVDPRRVDKFIGDIEKRGVNQHQRNDDELPDRDQRQRHKG